MVENNCLREELCVMERYRSAAFTRTSLTSYLLKLILQRRCTYVSAKSFNLYVLLRRKPLSLSLLFLYVCCCFLIIFCTSSNQRLGVRSLLVIFVVCY